jgi:nucleoid-associated protein YgaU
MKTIIKSLLFLLPVMMLHTAEAAVQKQGNPPCNHMIQAGDTLFDIAVAYYNGDGSQWTKIADANGIPHDNPVIVVGNPLKIP